MVFAIYTEDRQRDGKIHFQAHVRVQIAGTKMDRDYLGMEKVSLIRLNLEHWLWRRPFLWLG